MESRRLVSSQKLSKSCPRRLMGGWRASVDWSSFDARLQGPNITGSRNLRTRMVMFGKNIT
jgi:hypothetical protein